MAPEEVAPAVWSPRALLAERSSPKGTSSWAAVVLALDGPSRSALAIEDGLPSKELHCTLTVHGKVDELGPDAFEKLKRAVEGWAGGRAPFEAQVGGIGRFAGDDEGGDPVYLPVDCARLTRERPDLLKALAKEGVKAREDHGFNAHITLAYIDPEDDLPVQRIDKRTLTFGRVEVWYGGKRAGYNLSKEAQEHVRMDARTLRALSEIASTPTERLAQRLREAEEPSGGHEGEKMVFGTWRKLGPDAAGKKPGEPGYKGPTQNQRRHGAELNKHGDAEKDWTVWGPHPTARGKWNYLGTHKGTYASALTKYADDPGFHTSGKKNYQGVIKPSSDHTRVKIQ